MRRRVLGDNKILKGTIVEDGSYEVGNLVLYDKAQGKKIVIDINSPSQEFPLTAFVPLAVITIPQSHDVYGTGEAGAMSLLGMNYNTPDTGANTDQPICWGGNGKDLTELTNFNQCNKIDNTTGEITGSGGFYLPSDQFSSTPSIDDPTAKYYSTSYANSAAPSPYLYDAETDTYGRNPKYYSTDKVAANTLSDFRGKENTAVMLSYATAQEDWRTSMGHDAVPEETETHTETTAEGLQITWATQTGEWTESENTSAVDGKKFTSVSPGSNGSTVLRCTFQGNAGDKIVFTCKSDGEANYDYLTIGNLDTACTRSTFKESLKGKQNVTTSYVYELPDNAEHYVEFCYSKNNSGDNGTDSAVVYINTSVDITTITVPAQAALPPIVHKYDQGYYPAACCCWRFNPEGTEQGDWYLPAFGELGYVMARWKVIKASIQAVRDAGGEALAVLLLEHDYYWSSSEYDSNHARRVDAGSGHVGNNTKSGRNYNYYVRGFLRVGGSEAS